MKRVKPSMERERRKGKAKGERRKAKDERQVEARIRGIRVIKGNG
jgi:hypothetical protein